MIVASLNRGRLAAANARFVLRFVEVSRSILNATRIDIAVL